MFSKIKHYNSLGLSDDKIFMFVTYRLLMKCQLFTFSLLQKSLPSWTFIHTVSYLYVSPNVVSKWVVEISGLCQRERGQHHWLDCPTNKTSICSRKPNQMEETCLPDKDKFCGHFGTKASEALEATCRCWNCMSNALALNFTWALLCKHQLHQAT